MNYYIFLANVITSSYINQKFYINMNIYSWLFHVCKPYTKHMISNATNTAIVRWEVNYTTSLRSVRPT